MKSIIDRFNPKKVPIDQFEKIGALGWGCGLLASRQFSPAAQRSAPRCAARCVPSPVYARLLSCGVGNSPVQIHKRQFAAISDSWFKLSIAIKNDTEADKEFGWVQEM